MRKKSIKTSSAWGELAPLFYVTMIFFLPLIRDRSAERDRSEEMELNGNLCATFTESSM